jgi:hypothetical protein
VGKGRLLGERAGVKGSGTPFHQQLPSPQATGLSSSNRPFLQQPPFPPATALSLRLPTPFCHPERSEGSAVPRTFPGNVFLLAPRSGEAFGNKGVVGKEEAGRPLCVLADADPRRNQEIVGQKAVVPDLQIGFR